MSPRFTYLPERRGRIACGLTHPGSQHRHGDVVEVSGQVGSRHPDLYVVATDEAQAVPVAALHDFDSMTAAEVKTLARSMGATTRESASRAKARAFIEAE